MTEALNARHAHITISNNLATLIRLERMASTAMRAAHESGDKDNATHYRNLSTSLCDAIDAMENALEDIGELR